MAATKTYTINVSETELDVRLADIRQRIAFVREFAWKCAQIPGDENEKESQAMAGMESVLDDALKALDTDTLLRPSEWEGGGDK